MNIRPIHTEADDRAAIADISALMASDPAPCTDAHALDVDGGA